VVLRGILLTPLLSLYLAQVELLAWDKECKSAWVWSLVVCFVVLLTRSVFLGYPTSSSQMWGIALMFWWGGWLLFNYPGVYSFRDYLISMFSLLLALPGLTIAAEGAVDGNKAKLAAARIFELTDRQSLIDPLSTEGKKDI
jgi:hypothetical protein